jgi:type IV pilus modification protein PilV
MIQTVWVCFMPRHKSTSDKEPAAKAWPISYVCPPGKLQGGSAIRNQLVCEKGFTLIELAIAMLLLAVGILSVLAMQSVAFKSNSIANQLSVANTLAEEALEDLLSKDASLGVFQATNTTGIAYSGYPVVPATSPVTYTGTVKDPTGGSYSATYTVVVGTSSNGIPSGMCSVAVTVTYTYKGQQKTVTVSDFKSTV